jgi:hypothetical protein
MLSRCDLCYDKNKSPSVKVSAEVFVEAVRKGFDPFRSQGITMPRTLIAYGLGDESTYVGWKNLELVRAGDRELCADCFSAFSKFVDAEKQAATASRDLPETQPTLAAGITQPTGVRLEEQPGKVEPVARKKIPGWLLLLIIVVLISIGILGGYASGMGRRYAAENDLVTGQLQEQFQLGMQAVNDGQYEIAKQHFEFILQHNSNFPGVRAAYADLLLHMMITPTLAPSPTPTVSPTPDLRGVDVIYGNVVTLLSASGKDLCAFDWNDILGKLDSLRKADITFRPAEVDGMYYIALRNRGICKIYPQRYEPDASCQSLNINLEGGIYDLTLAERFGPLDSDASAQRTWARMYIAGSSFWDQDWVQVKNLFSQVMASMPQLADSTCITATERYRLASIGYAEQLMSKGDYCGAEGQFEEAFSINSSKNESFYPTATEVQNICNGDSPAPTTPTP